MGYDIIEKQATDPGQRTIGQLMTERAEALVEIRQLRAQLAKQAQQRMRLTKSTTATTPEASRRTRASAVPGALLRLSDVCARLSVSKATIYRWVAEGLFPSPIHIGRNLIRWPVEAVDAWQVTAGQPSSSQKTTRRRAGFAG